jgi:hypothetical protein
MEDKEAFPSEILVESDFNLEFNYLSKLSTK